MSAAAGPNVGIDASGFDYIEGSGFVMEGLEDKGLDAKSYIQSVLRRHEGKVLSAKSVKYWELMRLIFPFSHTRTGVKRHYALKYSINYRWGYSRRTNYSKGTNFGRIATC